MKALAARTAMALLLTATNATAVEVTLCAVDTQVSGNPNDRNLRTALQLGGRITFRCPVPGIIRMTMTHAITRDTEIDGGGTVTLDGLGNRLGMFVSADDAVRLSLSSIRVRRAGGPPRPGIPGFINSIGRLSGGFIAGRYRSVELRAVAVDESWFPVTLRTGSLRVLASTFENNVGTVLAADVIEVLDRSRFTNNRGSPISGRAVTIDRSTFTGNSAPVRVFAGRLKASQATFNSNVATGDGGALNLRSNATIEESTFRDNGAANGGAIFIGGDADDVLVRAVKFDVNVATRSGGAIAFEKTRRPSTLTMKHVTFQDNRASTGGALSLERDFFNNLVFTGAAVAFVRNRAAERGGAIYAPNASIKLNRGVFIENRAGLVGGAVAAHQQGDRATVFANSLLVRNTAPKGAAFWGNAATFVNATIAENGGTTVWAEPVPFGPLPGSTWIFPIEFVNTIIAGAVTGGGACSPTSSTAPYVDGGHNLQFPGHGCGSGIASAYPFLGPYYVPFVWSPALNAGNPAICDAAPINRKDLYNARRPLGGSACAIGAVEGDIEHLVRRWTRSRGDLTFSR